MTLPEKIMDKRTTFEEYLKQNARRVNEELDRLIPGEDIYPQDLHKAMRYSVFSGGKRIRPILAIAAAQACGGLEPAVLPTAASIEMIHAYSLIHDDLPAMDDEEYRRGKLSCHRAFGEDIAILAGDALLSQAFEVMDQKVCKDIARAIGTKGMVGGQVADIKKNNKSLTIEDLDYIHAYKTGALIGISVKAGAVLSGAGNGDINKLHEFGKILGFAFQIIDDVFDEEDYAKLLGCEKARQKAQEMIAEAKKTIAPWGEKAWALNKLADFVVERKL